MVRKNGILSTASFISLCILVFAIPWENMLLIPGIGTISRLVGILVIILGTFAIITDNRGRESSPFLWLTFVFLLYSLSSYYWSINQEETIKSVITFGQIFIFIWLIWEYVREEWQVITLLGAYVLGSFVSVFDTISAYLSGDGYVRYSAANFDPNDLGLILALGVPMAIFLGIRVNQRIVSWIFFLYIPIASFAILLTSSRASFLALLVGLSYSFTIFKNLKLPKRVGILILILLFSPVFISQVPVSSYERLATIGNEISQGTLNSRMMIWSSGIDAFSMNPFFGVGAGSFGPGIQPYLGHSRSPHNFFISVLVEKGIVGILIVLGIILIILNNVTKLPYNQKYLGFFLMITWFIGTLSVGWEQRKSTWFIFTIIIVLGHLSHYGEKKNEPHIS